MELPTCYGQYPNEGCNECPPEAKVGCMAAIPKSKKGMRAVVCILAALLLVSAGLNVLLTREVRGLQLVALERLVEYDRLHTALIDRAGDTDRERLWQEDVEYLYTIIAAYENRIHRPLPSRKIKRFNQVGGGDD